MKKYLSVIFLLSIINVWGQSKHFEIKWQYQNQLKQSGVLPDEFILFQSDNYQYQAENVYFSKVWNEVQAIDSRSVKLSNIKIQRISPELISRLGFKNLPDSFIPELVSSKARQQIYATFRVNTFIKKAGAYFRLNEFDLKYTYDVTANRSIQTQNIYDSKLGTGEWYRFKIDKTGVYKINRDFIKSLGINTDNLDPHKIKVFGNGGKMMPLRNHTPYPEDITEVPIQVIGEQDGSFDKDDYILFYAQSHKEWSDEYDSNLNIYTNETNYFIEIDDQDGQRMQLYQEPSGTPTETFTDYLAGRFYEKDKTIFTYIGRKVFDEPLDVSSNHKTLEFKFDNRLINKPVFYSIEAATNKGGTYLTASINQQNISQLNFSQNSTYAEGVEVKKFGNIIINSDPIKVDLTYHNNNFFDAHLYLEYVNIKAYCSLKGNGKQFRFFNPDADAGTGLAAYHFSQAQDIKQIWDITDKFHPRYLNNTQNSFDIKFLKQDRKRFIAVTPQDYYTPEKASQTKVTNQNLHKDLFYHTGQFKDLDYLIVTPAFLHQKAERFAEIHRQNGMNVYVADLKKIYLEFGNGQQDIAAIRNMVKYVYKNASAPNKRLKFLMLFGDASNDFKNVIPENLLTNGRNTNIVPIFESLESFHLVTSYASDDFYAMMDDNEGLLNNGEKPDIAVGRLLVSTEEEAETIYKKYEHYLSDATKLNWRTFITLWSDDADPGKSGDISFVNNTEAIAQNINLWHPEYNLNKIYQDAYQQISTAGGARYPDAKRDLFNTFERGTLILGYIGHGNEVALSHERMLTLADVEKLHNFDRLPLMTTMTCEFAKFDNPTRETAAEHLIWNKNGGVLEMVSTIREIWTSDAKTMNTDFYKALFGTSNTANGQIIKNPAEALRMAKIYNASSGSGKFNIAFLGDPAFDLGFSQPKIVLTSVNNQPTDTLKALKHIIIKGDIRDASGNLMTNFNGTINPIVFDKYKTANVLDNDHNDYTMQFQKLGSKLFQGKSDIVNGQFQFEFIVPKDINLTYGKGRLSFYAVGADEEKIGYDETITVGGVDANAEADNKPPVIKAFMNDKNFVSGGITDANPYLLLELQDEHGINTIGGIGHDIAAYLDDDQTKVFILNDFYETENNTYQRGKVKYRLFNLKPGWHTLHVKAWDVYNNSGTTEIEFQVVENKDIKLDHVLNYPNPFVNYTEFWFNHNHPFEDLDVMVQVYTISGKMVWQHRQSIISDGFLSRDIKWDGRDNFGNKLAKGVYIYKLSVRTLTGKTAQKIEKLVIL